MLLLERGKPVEHAKDYPNARKGPWEYPHRGARTQAMVAAYPVTERDDPLNEKNLDWWVNEQDAPYTEVTRFDWYRGSHLGGPHRRRDAEHPVFVNRFDRSMFLANSLALKLAGIDERTPNPTDGIFDKDAQGRLTGIVRASAVDLVRKAIPPARGRCRRRRS